MASVLIVGCEFVTGEWARALGRAGHSVEECRDTLAFQERFLDAPADILVVEIAHADHGEAMLMAQVRSVWPDCRVIAVSRDRSYQSSAIFDMGLWRPDLLLIQPVQGAQMVESVRRLRVQAQFEQPFDVGDSPWSRSPEVPATVILRCGEPVHARWLVRPD